MKKYYEVTRGNNTFIYTGETNKDNFRKDTLQVFSDLKEALIDIIVRHPNNRVVNLVSANTKGHIDLKDPDFKYQDIYSRASMLRTNGTGICKKQKRKVTSKKRKNRK